MKALIKQALFIFFCLQINSAVAGTESLMAGDSELEEADAIVQALWGVIDEKWYPALDQAENAWEDALLDGSPVLLIHKDLASLASHGGNATNASNAFLNSLFASGAISLPQDERHLKEYLKYLDLIRQDFEEDSSKTPSELIYEMGFKLLVSQRGGMLQGDRGFRKKIETFFEKFDQIPFSRENLSQAFLQAKELTDLIQGTLANPLPQIVVQEFLPKLERGLVTRMASCEDLLELNKKL